MRTTALIPLIAALSGQAATYHVAPTGNNGNTGLTVGQAWATPQHAADVAVAGDSVLVHPGGYQGFAAMDQSGTANAPIVFMCTGAVNITSPCDYNDMDGINVENVAWVVIEGFTVNGMPRTGIRSALSDHVTIRYNTCADNGVWGILTGFAEHCTIEHNTCSGSVDQHGIYFSNSSDDPIIRYNHCFDNHDNGIHMNGDESQGGDGIISNAQVYGNIIHGNGTGGGSGINCDGVVNSLIYNNLLYDNHASGISLYQIDAGAPSTNDKVFNNTIINASDARWCVNITDGCTGNQVLNNILINQHPFRGSIVVAEDALPGFVSDYNLVVNSLSPDGDATIYDLAGWQALGYDQHSQVVEPMPVLFASPGTGDFHPVDANAQMVNAGTGAVSNEVPVDLDGNPRPQGSGYDIGCYEADQVTVVADHSTSAVRLWATDDAVHVSGATSGSMLVINDQLGRTLVRSLSRGEGEWVVLAPRGTLICSLRDAVGGTVIAARALVLE